MPLTPSDREPAAFFPALTQRWLGRTEALEQPWGAGLPGLLTLTPKGPCRVRAETDPLPDADPLLGGGGGAEGGGGGLLGPAPRGRSRLLQPKAPNSAPASPLRAECAASPRLRLARREPRARPGIGQRPGDRAAGLARSPGTRRHGGGGAFCLRVARLPARQHPRRPALRPLPAATPRGPRDRGAPCSAGRTHLVLLAARSQLLPVCLKRKVSEASASDQRPGPPGVGGIQGRPHP